ncbi:VOC family protein [Thalassomonas actiniarum]|uniref:Glyoxalase/bleomycin resistance/dioxygenase family protein n=1 Tax=Thalassomonas actiniarum TaxID=485447 RepID=A0AAF0C3B3_9GAMM|nr:glyoxalase/bleomycin resistance/dioxygenase family protein [Thalassomonas actiniarum]WDD99397.1 glyoxalase/bleomycin resistance/dioxygenase family protein [Thalassomonas actiniarum]
MKKVKLKPLILSALFGFSALSQAAAHSAGKAGKNTGCFDDISLPESFIAFDSGFDSELAAWYQQVFQLETVKTFTFPDGNTKGILMKRGHFVVEVFNKKALTEAAEKIPDKPGIMKFGFFTRAKLPQLQTCLQQHGIKAPRIFQDTNLAAGLLLVVDPEGNMFEIISPD